MDTIVTGPIKCPHCNTMWAHEMDLMCLRKTGIETKCCGHPGIGTMEERQVAMHFRDFVHKPNKSRVTKKNIALINLITLASDDGEMMTQLELAFPVHIRLFYEWQDDPMRFYIKYPVLPDSNSKETPKPEDDADNGNSSDDDDDELPPTRPLTPLTPPPRPRLLNPPRPLSPALHNPHTPPLHTVADDATVVLCCAPRKIKRRRLVFDD